MLVGIERGQRLNAAQRRAKQGLNAAQQGLLPVMQQRKIVVWIRLLLVRYRLLEPSHNRAKGIVLVKPVSKEMHANKRQTGRYLHDGCVSGHSRGGGGLARAPLGPIELPCGTPPIQMADADRYGCLPLGGLVEEHPARARRVLLE